MTRSHTSLAPDAPSHPCPDNDLLDAADTHSSAARPLVLDLLDIIILAAIALLTLAVAADAWRDWREPAPAAISVVSLSDIAVTARTRFEAAGVPDHEARLMAIYAVNAAETRLAEAQATGSLGSVFDRDALHVSAGLPDLTEHLLEISLEDVQHLLRDDARLDLARAGGTRRPDGTRTTGAAR